MRGSPKRPLHFQGFSLIGVCLAMIVVGLGVSAIMMLLGTATQHTSASGRMTLITNLANNMQELLVSAAYCDPNQPDHWGLETGETFGRALQEAKQSLDLDDFMGTDGKQPTVFGRAVNGSPKDAGWNNLVDPLLQNYTQIIYVACVQKRDLSTPLTAGQPDEGVRRIKIEILHRTGNTDQSVGTFTYLRFRDR